MRVFVMNAEYCVGNASPRKGSQSKQKTTVRLPRASAATTNGPGAWRIDSELIAEPTLKGH